MPSRRVVRHFSQLCNEKRNVDPGTLEEVLTLAVEIAREGREGRKVGTLFVVGDAEAVLELSRPLILDPLLGHSDDVRHIDDAWARETFKELAQLDGAFVVSDDGVVQSAARYIETTIADVDLPLGLGSRHMAGASISKATRAVAVVVSESSVVRLFEDGELLGEVIPELWMLERYGGFLGPEAERSTEGGSTVLSRPE